MSKKLTILLAILVVVMGAYFGTNVRAGVPHLQATAAPCRTLFSLVEAQ